MARRTKVSFRNRYGEVSFFKVKPKESLLKRCAIELGERDKEQQAIGAVGELKALLEDLNVIDNNTLYTKIENRIKELVDKGLEK